MSEALNTFCQNETALYKNLNEVLDRLKSEDNSSADVISSLSEVSEPLPKTAEINANNEIENLISSPKKE